MNLLLQFKPWKKFHAFRDHAADARFLRAVADESERAFRKGMRSRKSGRRYLKPGGRVHIASAPGEYPAVDTGRLMASIRTDVSRTESRIGTGMHYAIYLRRGTRFMARRRMSDDALMEGLRAARAKTPFRWMRWKRG